MNKRPPQTANRRISASLPLRCRRSGFLITSALVAVAVAAPAQAQLTRAGTLINNTASASYDDVGGHTNSVDSNTVSLRVDEVLDVAIASADANDVTTSPGASGQVLTFRVTNSGNGEERFRLTANGTITGDAFDASVTAIALDSDNNGIYDPGVDQLYVAGINDPLIAAEASLTVFVVAKVPSALTDGGRGIVSLAAAAVKGSGPVGTIFAGKGLGGGDAIVGSSTADRTAFGAFRASAALVEVVKSATVADQYGGTSIVPGATITYTLLARTTGSGSVLNLRIGDTVPDGTTYLPGTLTLDGATLTDATDGDAGNFSGNRAAVGLGIVPGGTQHRVTFNVKIN